jgi:pentose-5-phosphate-3-epimerase
MLDDDAREFFEERAAIMEFDGGLKRIEAELEAKALTEAFVARRAVFLDRK